MFCRFFAATLLTFIGSGIAWYSATEGMNFLFSLGCLLIGAGGHGFLKD